MDIVGLLADAKIQVYAALTLIFIVVMCILAAKRSMFGMIGTFVVFGVLMFTVNNPDWPADVMGWIIQRATI